MTHISVSLQSCLELPGLIGKKHQCHESIEKLWYPGSSYYLHFNCLHNVWKCGFLTRTWSFWQHFGTLLSSRCSKYSKYPAAAPVPDTTELLWLSAAEFNTMAVEMTGSLCGFRIDIPCIWKFISLIRRTHSESRRALHIFKGADLRMASKSAPLT